MTRGVVVAVSMSMSMDDVAHLMTWTTTCLGETKGFFNASSQAVLPVLVPALAPASVRLLCLRLARYWFARLRSAFKASI